MIRALVVSHDAGGAQVISSWVKRNKDICFKFLLGGPARLIFKQKLGEIDIIKNEDVYSFDYSNIDFVLTGTSWASKLENIAVATGKRYKVKTISYLDHWVNYLKRFNKSGSIELPDELWVGDKYALEIATKNFPQATIILKPNMFFEDMRENITSARKKDVKNRILLVTEPTSIVAKKMYKNPYYYGYTEFEAAAGFFEHFKGNSHLVESIRVRLHPSEEVGKYESVISSYTSFFRVECNQSNSLLEDCSWADWIVGCNSMVMAIGVVSGRKVFSCVPKTGKKHDLPFPEIMNLF